MAGTGDTIEMSIDEHSGAKLSSVKQGMPSKVMSSAAVHAC